MVSVEPKPAKQYRLPYKNNSIDTKTTLIEFKERDKNGGQFAGDINLNTVVETENSLLAVLFQVITYIVMFTHWVKGLMYPLFYLCARQEPP